MKQEKINRINELARKSKTPEGLTDAEKEAFPYMFLAACLYLVNWCTCYYDDFEGYNEYEYFYYLAHTVKLIHYVDDHCEELRKLAELF